MIFSSASQFNVYLPIQPGEGPSRGLLRIRDCENFADGSFAALVVCSLQQPAVLPCQAEGLAAKFGQVGDNWPTFVMQVVHSGNVKCELCRLGLRGEVHSGAGVPQLPDGPPPRPRPAPRGAAPRPAPCRLPLRRPAPACPVHRPRLRGGRIVARWPPSSSSG